MPDQISKYYDYLKKNGADVAPSLESFQKTLSDEKSAKQYYDYLKTNKFDTPDTFDSFVNTFGLKKKESTPLQPSDGVSPFQTGSELASGAFLKKIGRPLTLEEGIQRDKKKNDSVIGGIYNTLVGSISRGIGGLVETGEILNKQLEKGFRYITGEKEQKPQDIKWQAPNITGRQLVSSEVEKLRTTTSSKESEQARSQFDITNGISSEDVKGMLFQAPSQILDMAMGAFTRGSSFFVQSVNDNAKELEENPNANKLTDNQKLGYLFTQAAVQAALEKFSVDKILKSTGISSKVKQKIANEITEDFVKRGIKATAQDIEAAAIKKASSFATKAKNIGLKSLSSAGIEGITEGMQQMASDGIKLIANKTSGNEVFDEENIKENFLKNTINSAIQGGLMGGVFGGLSSIKNNTNKAIRNEIAKTNDLEAVQQKIGEQVELGNITEEEANKANITAQQYAQIASKIPQEVSEEQKYKIIGGIEQRENLTKEIENTKKEIVNTDPAFQEDANNRLELLEAKLEQTTDYLNDLVKGKKTTYRKEIDGEKTTYYKTDANGEETKISREYYDLATAIREENKAKKAAEKEQPIVEETITEQSPTLLEEDVRQAEMQGEPEQITQSIELSTEIKTETPSTPIEHKIGDEVTVTAADGTILGEKAKITAVSPDDKFIQTDLGNAYVPVEQIKANETTPTEVSKPTEAEKPIVEEVSEVIGEPKEGKVSEASRKYEEIGLIKTEKIRNREKGKFVEDHFENIVSQLMLKNKIKRIC